METKHEKELRDDERTEGGSRFKAERSGCISKN